MSTPGGSLQALSIKNRRFPVVADNDPTIAIGGMSNEVGSFGDGTVQVTQTRMPGSLEGVKIGIDHDNDDMAFLQEVADSGELVPIALEMVSGHVYQSRMVLVDTPGLSPMSNTCEVNLKGEKQQLQSQ